MEPSHLVVISSDEEDNKPKTSLDKKSRSVGSSTVRNGAAIKNPPRWLQFQNSPTLPQLSPHQQLIRSKSAEVLCSPPEVYESTKRAMSASCLMPTARASIRATKSLVVNEKRPITRHHEPTRYTLIKQSLAPSRPHTSKETSAGAAKSSDGVSTKSPSAQALVDAHAFTCTFPSMHESSQPTTATTGTMNSYQSTSQSVAPPCLNPSPRPTYIPRPPCLNPTPRPSFVDPFPEKPYLKDSYPAASKAVAPQQYVSPYPQQHPSVRRPQHQIDHPMPALQPSKRKADSIAGNASKRIRKEITNATPTQLSSPARSNHSKSPGNFHVPCEPSIAVPSPRPPRNRGWTSVMLVDFAETLRKSFDFPAFSAKHGKAVKDIRDTFEMVVSKPIFEYSSRGMARARMQTFNQKLKQYVAWMKRGGRDVHGELTTSPWKLSDTAKAKQAETTPKAKKGRKPAKPAPAPAKAPGTPKRARALKAPGEPLVYKDGVYQ